MNREQPKIKAVAGAARLLQSNGYIRMVDPLMKMGNLTRQDYVTDRVIAHGIESNMAEVEVDSRHLPMADSTSFDIAQA